MCDVVRAEREDEKIPIWLRRACGRRARDVYSVLIVITWQCDHNAMTCHVIEPVSLCLKHERSLQTDEWYGMKDVARDEEEFALWWTVVSAVYFGLQTIALPALCFQHASLVCLLRGHEIFIKMER